MGYFDFIIAPDCVIRTPTVDVSLAPPKIIRQAMVDAYGMAYEDTLHYWPYMEILEKLNGGFFTTLRGLGNELFDNMFPADMKIIVCEQILNKTKKNKTGVTVSKDGLLYRNLTLQKKLPVFFQCRVGNLSEHIERYKRDGP